MRLMRQPCRHIAAVGHAFVLFDFLRGILSEVGIGKVGKEVAEKVVVIFIFSFSFSSNGNAVAKVASYAHSLMRDTSSYVTIQLYFFVWKIRYNVEWTSEEMGCCRKCLFPYLV